MMAEGESRQEQQDSERRARRFGRLGWTFGCLSIVAGAVSGITLTGDAGIVSGVAGLIAGAAGGLATFGRFFERQTFHTLQAAAYGLNADQGNDPKELARIRSTPFQ